MQHTKFEINPAPAIVTSNRPFRHNTYEEAVIVHNAGSEKVECIVRNLSDNGVKLKRLNNDFVPDHFQLVIPDERLTLDCQVRWRTSQEIGAEFVNQAVAECSA